MVLSFISDFPLFRAFYKYLQEQKHTNEFDCWIEIERLKLLPVVERNTEKGFIYKTFIKEGAPCYVKSPKRLKKKLSENSRSSRHSRNLSPTLAPYTELQVHLEQELEPLYSAFTVSEVYHAFVDGKSIQLERTEYSLMLECIFYTKERFSCSLRRSSTPKRITELLDQLSVNEIPDESSKSVTLDLSGQFEAPESPDIVQSICKALKTNNTLKHLNISHTHLTDENVQLLAAALSSNCCLQSLDLSHNLLTDKGTTHLIYMLRENANNKLKQIYLHNNPSISPNTELIIWNIIASRQLPTALDIIDSNEKRQQKQLNKIKQMRKKLLFLMNDLQQYESRNRACIDMNRSVRGNLQKAIAEMRTSEDFDHQITLLDCLSESAFSCELDSMIARMEWVWKDSLVRDWKRCAADVEAFQQLEERESLSPFLQHPLLHFVTKKMLVVILSPSGTSLLSVIAKHERQRMTQGIIVAVKNQWIAFSLSAVAQILLALEYLHKHRIVFQLLTPRNIYLLTEQLTNPQLRLPFLYGKDDLRKKLKAEDQRYLAPELFQGPYDTRVDIYSLGQITQDLFVPYLSDQNSLSLAQSDGISVLIQSCTAQNPGERITIPKLKDMISTICTSFALPSPF